VVLDDASMLDTEKLPDDLTSLIRRNAEFAQFARLTRMWRG